MIERELFRQIPGARARIPWTQLALLPTDIERLTLQLPGIGARQLWVKRDDRAGNPYGGNKVRKLEFLLADAIDRKCTRVITAGAFGSHHALATTVYARRLGLQTTVILFPQRITPHVRHILFMIAGLGAEIRFTRRMEFVPVALQRVKRSFGSSAYVVKPGGSDALGTIGYVECGLELARQWADGIAPRPGRIHLAAGTLGTTAGLALGLAMADETAQVVATRITSLLVTNEHTLIKLIRGARALLEAEGVVLPSTNDVMRRITFVHDQIGDGYGLSTMQSDRATATFHDAGINLDTTYTAKAAAALLADSATGKGETLFINTLSSIEPDAAANGASLTDFPHQIATRLAKANKI